ncbi:hypothetical protein T01_15071 [Trichinella spiralis]|uniref:Uncharacterized protein n=1 Tax=Trichinella spiralis TaxID=6334 RepID=A0A0V1B5B0_TRISP|nr:hypothetical protein T01_15071 [Trichinella spiralis]
MLVATLYGMDMIFTLARYMTVLNFENARFADYNEMFCCGLELHVRKDRSQPKGDANLLKIHIVCIIKQCCLIRKGSAFVVATGKLYLLINLTIWFG